MKAPLSQLTRTALRDPDLRRQLRAALDQLGGGSWAAAGSNGAPTVQINGRRYVLALRAPNRL